MSTQIVRRKNDPLSLENRLRAGGKSTRLQKPASAPKREAAGWSVNPFHVITGFAVLAAFYFFVQIGKQQGAQSQEANSRAAELLDAQYLAADEARLAEEAGSANIELQ